MAGGVNMKYAVADVTVPLDSVSQLCDAGNTVVFTAKGGVDNWPGRQDRLHQTPGYVPATHVGPETETQTRC